VREKKETSQEIWVEGKKWLKKQLLEEGKTLADLARQFGVSREWMRKIKEEYKIDLNKKKLSWYLKRWKIPSWATKNWFLKQKKVGLKKLGERLGVSSWIIYNYLKKLKLNPKEFYKRSKMVKLVCSWCGKTFKRKKYWAREKKLAFCNKKHQGFWLGKNFNPRARQERVINKE
jgi:Zn-dependent peptidase ImmA (M78 family)